MQKQQYKQQRNMGLAQSLVAGPALSEQKTTQQFILLTYRSGIVPVEKTTYYTSDSGWGCMLRVAQMFIANLIHLKEPQFSIESIVKLFYDNLMVPFSIQNMTRLSKQMFPHMKPYDWYTPCQAGFLVKDMLQKFDIRYKVKICNDGAMFLDDIKDQANQQLQTQQKQDKEKDIKQKVKLQQKAQEENDNYEQRIVVFLMARIGLDQPQPSYLKCVTKLMQNQYFISIMGGTPRHAHLIIAHQQQCFGYLDPHTTQYVVPDYAKISHYMHQYTSKLLWMKESKVDSSMCIAFCFLKSEIEDFWKSMLALKSQMKEAFFIYLDQKRPQFDQNCILQIQDCSDQEA